MPTWRVTVTATVVKTYEVRAGTEEEAEDEAHATFSVEEDGTPIDYYNQDASDIEKVTPKRSRPRRR